MANDRLRLVCRFCGESKMLFKFYPHSDDCCPGSSPELRGYVQTEDILDKFLGKHIYGCAKLLHKNTMNREVVFRLVTEDDKTDILGALARLIKPEKRD
jgi:hypothetical protein